MRELTDLATFRNIVLDATNDLVDARLKIENTCGFPNIGCQRAFAEVQDFAIALLGTVDDLLDVANE